MLFSGLVLSCLDLYCGWLDLYAAYRDLNLGCADLYFTGDLMTFKESLDSYFGCRNLRLQNAFFNCFAFEESACADRSVHVFISGSKRFQA